MAEPSARAQRILRALKADPGCPHHTEFFSLEGRCSLAEAVVELMRLEREYDGRIERGRSYAGMTWKWSHG